eukprot:1434957-Pyramimonas_sp.AAC.1
MDGVLEYCGYLAGEWKEESKSIPSNPVGDASQRFSQHNYEGSQLYVNPFRRNELAVYNLSVSTSQFLFQDGGPRLIHTGHQPRTSRATSLFLPLTNMQTRSLAGLIGRLYLPTSLKNCPCYVTSVRPHANGIAEHSNASMAYSVGKGL